jgi:hypothetical protein
MSHDTGAAKDAAGDETLAAAMMFLSSEALISQVPILASNVTSTYASTRVEGAPSPFTTRNETSVVQPVLIAPSSNPAALNTFIFSTNDECSSHDPWIGRLPSQGPFKS